MLLLAEQGALSLDDPLRQWLPSLPATTQHRRILHYEFSGIEELPDGYVWHDFIK